jgi:hypothetical protein
MNANRSRVHATRDQSQLDLWLRRLQEFEQRDCTVDVYCKELGVSTPTFYYWRSKVAEAPRRGRPPARGKNKSRAAKRPGSKKVRQSGFLPVVLNSHSNANNVSIELTSGVRVEVPIDAHLALANVLDRVFV